MAPPKEQNNLRGFCIHNSRGLVLTPTGGYSTNCLQSGSDCIYPSPEQDAQNRSESSPSQALCILDVSADPTISLNWSLNDYVGGSFDDLPEASKRLLRHFSQVAVQGQRPIAREVESSLIHRGFENSGYMHMCLMLAACQWAWVTGSMDGVSIPFLYHKAATYQFVREQLQNVETAQSGGAMLAISALALTEGAIGELGASIGNGLRTGKSGRLMDVPHYQPTFMALLFASIWDITALPPREAPKYGWWEETDTQAARLWQNHTKDLNLNYELSRSFDPGQYIPRILNGDPRSSRTSFVATFFYLFSEMGHRQLDVVLIDWILEQLIDDVNSGQENLTESTWSQPLWLWCVMFGAAIARMGKAATLLEERQLQKWRNLYSEKIMVVSHALGITSWASARGLLKDMIGAIDEDVDLCLQEIWDDAVDLSEPDKVTQIMIIIFNRVSDHCDFSFNQSLVSNSGMFSFSQTEPSADLLSSSAWATTAEGPQNFPDFPDTGSSHSGEAEDFMFTSGQTTPRGTRVMEPCQATEATWDTSRSAQMASTGGQAMSRANSSRSSGSSLSQSSHLSNMDARGNTSAFRNGSQAPPSMVGMDSCLLLDSDASAVPSQVYWPSYTVDMGLSGDGSSFNLSDVSPLHVVPAQMQLGPDVSLPDNSSPGSWECFSSSISRTSSPATIDEAWLSAPLSPHSSPEIQCQSPRYVGNEHFDTFEFASHDVNLNSADRKPTAIPDELSIKALPQLEEALTLPPSFTSRRHGNEGESARDHALYKNAVPQADGLFHCPWEGQPSCNHKPEKLKCNYDKFVDSHLKPYRCKAESCEGARFSSTACLLRHEREAHGLHGHGDKPFLCMYEGCERAVPGNGFPRQWNLRDHMKRVHNDHGSAGGSPPAATQQPKGRKRKTDVPEAQATPSRKTSVKSVQPADSQQTSAKPLLEQWLDHRKAVEDILRSLDKPEDVRNIQQISEVQRRLNAMAKMTSDLSALPKTDILPAPGRRSFASTG
ncbi:hypothetical protein HJFPF1_02773 [Paramyrothecium foliicola]|nr:hypothetical protein HJFPF1_02773 [Paramyrothecium foliicola]